MSKVIVVDDIKSYCNLVCAELDAMGIEAVSCQTVKKAKWLIERAGKNDVVLADLVLNDESGMSGTDLLKWMRREGHYQLFFLMTGYGTMENSIETMEAGAKSYIPKDQINEKFYAKIKTIMQERNLKDKRNCRLIFRRDSVAFRKLYERIQRFAKNDIRIVFIGESGTGRSHLAEDLIMMEGHQNGDYAHVNCGALAEMEHVEDYFFGHQKGAFSSAVQSTDGILEKANDSFLFLENVDLMPLSVQNLLIGVITKGEYSRIGTNKIRTVDFKVVSTSATDLDVLVRKGLMTQQFRDSICEDVVYVPSLRETVTDIVPLATFFMQHLDEKRRLSKEAKQLLERYSWPGNVRELVRVMELAVKKFDSDIILPEHLSFSANGLSDSASTMKLNDAKEEREKIVKALESCGYRREPTADLLGISRRSLFMKMKQYGIEVPRRNSTC